MAHEKEYLDKDKFFELQYNTLRKEIETRQERHFKLAAGALLILPAVQLLKLLAAGPNGAAAGISSPLLIAAPIFVLSLYILYFSEHFAIRRCGRYIKGQIEAPMESAIPKITGWETWLDKDPRIHEKEQLIGFHLLFIALYIITVIAAASAVTQLLDPTAAFWRRVYWIDPTAAFWRRVYWIVGGLAVLCLWIVQAVATRRS